MSGLTILLIYHSDLNHSMGHGPKSPTKMTSDSGLVS